MSRRMRAFWALTLLAAVALLATQPPHALASEWGHYVAWVVICLVSETMWSTTLSGEATWSLAATAGLSAVVLWGPEAGMWIAALSTLIADVFVQRKPWVRAVFNSAAIVITSWVAGQLFALLGGRTGLPSGPAGAALQRGAATTLVLPFVGLVLAYWLLNRAMVSLAVAWSTDRRWWGVMRDEWLFVAKLEVDASSFLLVPLMVISFTAIGYPGVLLFYAPLFMLFQSDKRYAELKKAEEQNLRSAVFVAKGEFAAKIGHNLNNMLVAIKGRAQMLLKDAERDRYDNTPRNAQIILEQSERMAEMAKALMAYTRVQVDLEPMDLNGLLENTIEFVKSDPKFRNVEWEVDLDPKLPEIKGDTGQIQSVFINLFVNAVDAMAAQESRKAIFVTTHQEDRSRSAQVTIADSGPGILPEHLGRMFEFRFTTKQDGHGFGLSTAQLTIEKHGGTMTVESPPGSGARFMIVLPVGGPGGWS